jgi:hypothetical protein
MPEFAVSERGRTVSPLDMKVQETAVIAYDRTVSPSGMTETEQAITDSGHTVSFEAGTGQAGAG